jgi:hypothetical protein
MKLLASLLVVSVFIHTTLLPYAAFGAEVTFNSTQSALQGQVPVHKIGALLLSEGLALLNGDEIKVEAKDHVTGHSAPVLQGNLFNVTTSEEGSKTVLQGFTYFRSGPLLSKVETSCSDESVDLKDGSHIAGPINDVAHDMLTVGARQIATSSIATIHSPRVYQFKMNVAGKNEPPLTGAVNNIDFSPTCLVAHAEPHTSNGKKRAVIIGLVVAGIATGIACGVAIPLGVHHHHNTITFPKTTTPTLTTTTVTALPLTPPPRLVFVPPRVILPPRIIPPRGRGIITTNVNSVAPPGGRTVNPNGTVTGTVVLAQGQGSSVSAGTPINSLPFSQRIFVLNPNLIFFTRPPVIR